MNWFCHGSHKSWMKLRCLETCFQMQSVYIFNRVIGKSPRHRKNCPYGLCFNYFTCRYAMIKYNVLYVVELLSGFGLRYDSSVKSTVLLFEDWCCGEKSSAFLVFETLTCFLKNLSIYNFFLPLFLQCLRIFVWNDCLYIHIWQFDTFLFTKLGAKGCIFTYFLDPFRKRWVI